MTMMNSTSEQLLGAGVIAQSIPRRQNAVAYAYKPSTRKAEMVNELSTVQATVLSELQANERPHLRGKKKIKGI